MFFVFGLVLLKISAGVEINSTETSEQIPDCKPIADLDSNITEGVLPPQTNQTRIKLIEAPEHSFALPSDPETSYKSLLSSSFGFLLKNYIKPDNHRYGTFMKISELMIARNVKMIVETGTARTGIKNCASDGCSTVIFGLFCKLSGAFIYSVDIDAKACKEATNAVKDFSDHVSVITSDSVAFLQKFDKGFIDFLYLDSYDFDSINPRPSQDHHRKEIEAVYDKLHKRTIVMVDDCRLPYGGKCSSVREFLLDQGWTLLMDSYQQIFVYEQ